MTSTTATASVPLRRDEAGRLFRQTMGLVALTAVARMTYDFAYVGMPVDVIAGS